MTPEGPRTEHDRLGDVVVPQGALHGISTERALANFALSGQPVHPDIVAAYGMVKLAAVRTNQSLGYWGDDPAKIDAIERACREMAEGALTMHVVVDALQGDAGASANMNVNEVLANRALELLDEPLGGYDRVSPLDDINLHQSANDTFPTALKLAAIWGIHRLEEQVLALQEAFQEKERQFAHIVKVGRTQYQDAVLTTLGREMSSYAEALSRDRWRISKCEERLRVVNLGGTTIGTGFAAPRQYVFRVVETLRELTSIGFARAENLGEATQNADVFVEVSGILKATAVTLIKVCGDVRLLSSGPQTGLGEIRLPPRQASPGLTPDAVYPVIPDAVTQAGLLAMGLDQALAAASAGGSLELNPFLPLVAHCLLQEIGLLANAALLLRRYCIEGLEADELRCRAHVEASTALAGALAPELGYEEASALADRAVAAARGVREQALHERILTNGQIDALLGAEAVTRLGTPKALPRSHGPRAARAPGRRGE